MENLLVEEKTVVVPGEAIAQSMDYLPGAGTYREGETIYAKRLGLFSLNGRATTIIPMSGRYKPKARDRIVIKVRDIVLSGWIVDTNSAYNAMLQVRDATSKFIPKGDDLTKYFKIGDYMVVKITNVTSQNVIDVSMKEPGLRKLNGGRIVEVNPQKVPRIIGKQGSMVNLVKDNTGCDIVVGQNGRVWVRGEDIDKENLAVAAIQKIEAEAHIPGLTDRMQSFLGGAQ